MYYQQRVQQQRSEWMAWAFPWPSELDWSIHVELDLTWSGPEHGRWLDG